MNDRYEIRDPPPQRKPRWPDRKPKYYRVDPEKLARRKKFKAENKKLRKLQNRGAVPVRAFSEETGKILLGSHWVDPTPFCGVPLEVKAGSPGYFYPPSLKSLRMMEYKPLIEDQGPRRREKSDREE